MDVTPLRDTALPGGKSTKPYMARTSARTVDGTESHVSPFPNKPLTSGRAQDGIHTRQTDPFATEFPGRMGVMSYRPSIWMGTIEVNDVGAPASICPHAQSVPSFLTATA